MSPGSCRTGQGSFTQGLLIINTVTVEEQFTPSAGEEMIMCVFTIGKSKRLITCTPQERGPALHVMKKIIYALNVFRINILYSILREHYALVTLKGC